MQRLIFFAPCAHGLEDILAEELRSLGAARVHAARAGVAFEGDLRVGYRACLWSRLASRVLLRITEVPAGSEEELYKQIRAIRWEEHLDVESTLAVDFTGGNSPITHSHYGALKVKDAIVDRFRDRTGVRPDVDTDDPDLRINIAARSRSAVVSIDLSGDALHRRGYREAGVQVEAPLKETLAAAIVIFAGWDELLASAGAGRGIGFLDPMCGSGTLVVEAALMAADRAPGLLRSRWGFDGWLGHEPDVWHEVLDEADERAEAGMERAQARGVVLAGADLDPRAIEIARSCGSRAGVGRIVRFDVADALTCVPPGPVSDADAPATGLVAVNPPYGERLGDEGSVAELYAGFSAHLESAFAGWRVAAITADDGPAPLFGVPVEMTFSVRNGRIPAHVAIGTMAPPLEDSMFANRLRKNAKRLRKWARKQEVSCYRVYDADMPEYSVAIDVYQGAGPDAGRTWAHVAEYAAPKTVDEQGAARRLAEVMSVVPNVLGVDRDDVVLKVRKRQRGSEQYEREESRARRRVVEEGGLLFEIDLASYLDTGLFLDHRRTRSMIRERVEGLRFCNLFAYTGSATVYAAAGGASQTTTVDLSKTYTEWARANMRRNGLLTDVHEFVRAEVLEWMEAQEPGLFDLIFMDPPTFSNSKRMEGTLDVQRDHQELIGAATRLLAPGGELWFSTNRRGFKFDDAIQAEEFTAETVSEDFSRRPKAHRIWRIVHQ